MWLFAFDLALLEALRLYWPSQKIEKLSQPIKCEETSDKLILEFEKDQEVHLVSTNMSAIQPMRTSPSIIVNENFVENMRFSKPCCYENQKKWFVPLSTYLLYHKSAFEQEGTCRIFTFEFGFVIQQQNSKVVIKIDLQSVLSQESSESYSSPEDKAKKGSKDSKESKGSMGNGGSEMMKKECFFDAEIFN